MPDWQFPYSRGLRLGQDRRIGQDDERARTSRELISKPAWKVTVNKTVAYDAKVWELVRVDPTSNDVSIILPRAENWPRAELYIKHVGTSGTVTVLPRAGEDIDGNATFAWSSPCHGYHFVAAPQYKQWMVI